MIFWASFAVVCVYRQYTTGGEILPGVSWGACALIAAANADISLLKQRLRRVLEAEREKDRRAA